MSTEDTDTYSEDRRRHLHRNRVRGFALCISLWMLSVIPLARELTKGHRGADVVLFYVAAAAINLGAAAVIHGIYARLTNSRFWSPWVFLIAALLSIAGYVVESAGEEPPPNVAATEAANEGRLGY
jgi:hypothetical protein